MLPLLVLLGTIAGAWYLLIVRPQKDQQSRHGQLVERLTVGDHVLTVGGIYGRVVAVEGTSVVLELAPGLTSRIATAGIARIVHGAEAALPTAMNDGTPPAALPTPRSALEDDMHHEQQHQHAPQQAYAPAPTHAPAPPAPIAVQHQLPQQPFAAAPTMQMPVAVHHPVAPQAPQPEAVRHETTFRAQVLPALPTFEPRPWGTSTPVNAPQQPQQTVQQQYAAPQQHAPQHHAPIAQQVHAPAQHAPILPPPPQLAAPAPMPLHAPFAPQQQAPVQHAPAQHAPVQHAPVQYAPQQPMAYAVPQHAPAPPQPHYAAAPQPMPVHPQHAVAPQPVQPQYAAAPVAAAVPVPVVEEDGRRHSRAPKGMGSSLRLDDPSLKDTIARARGERSELADEYRKLTAPLVDVPAQHAPVAEHAAAHAEPQFIGHDPQGVPLFAMPGGHVVAGAAQYPAPARPQHVEHGMPRPVVQAGHAPLDTAATSTAFQRRTPYAPQAEAAPAPVPAHA